MAKIELSEKEIALANAYMSHEIDPFNMPEEYVETAVTFADKATALVEELDAYEEMGDDLWAWFINKYRTQEAAEVAE